jgi:hypothetical protein
MYSLGLLIAELETARRRLRYVFEVPDGTLGTQPIPDGTCGGIGLSSGIPTRLAFADRMNRAIVAGDRPKWRLTSIHSTTEDITRTGLSGRLRRARSERSRR